MKNTLIALVVGMVGSVALSGCGGSGGNGSCGLVQPCGGDITGNWKITHSCVTSAGMATINSDVQTGLASDFAALCPTGVTPTASTNVSNSGSATYNSDMTYSAALTMSGSVSLAIPSSCLQGLSCSQVNTEIQAANPDPTMFSSISCSGVATCNCTFMLVPQTQTVSGTYTTSGVTLTETPSTGSPASPDYCVQNMNTELHLINVDTTMNMGPMGQLSILADIVLQKQ
jgi:hypothetical protein